MKRLPCCLFLSLLIPSGVAGGGARPAPADSAGAWTAAARTREAGREPAGSGSFDMKMRGREYFFFHGLGYGSDAMIHPIRLILNGGFGILQMDNRGNDLGDIDFRNGWDNVRINLQDPFRAIREEGFGDFLLSQIVPVSVNGTDSQYWPNYTLHLIGGGMSFRMMFEWFHARGAGHPWILSFLTLTTYHMLNEVVENDAYVGPNTDPIADVYIFNPLGMLLFGSERVSRFFSHTLHMADWSYQVSYDPWRNEIENHGQNFIMKYWLNGRRSVGLFYHFGNHGEIGLSFRRPGGGCVSVAAGLQANELWEIDGTDNLHTLSANLVPTAGFFYDRDNSLLLSLLYSRDADYKLRLNCYPGLVHVWKLSPGFFVSLDQEDVVSCGVTVAAVPVGLSGKP